MAEKSNRASLNSSFEDEDKVEWIVTYADMVTLLLVFFVLLYSLSSLDVQKFKAIAAELKKSFGNPTAVIEMVAPDVDKDKAQEEVTTKPVEEQLTDIRSKMIEDLDEQLLEEIRELVEKKRVGENILVYREKNRITIMVEGQVLFNSGQADLLPDAVPILEEITKIIKNHPRYRVNIKGHTDDQPISTLQFPSNWELSAVRATTVLRYLISQGVGTKRLTATGYGDLLPVAPNDSPGNRSKNRRVEFVLEKEKEDSGDPVHLR